MFRQLGTFVSNFTVVFCKAHHRFLEQKVDPLPSASSIQAEGGYIAWLYVAPKKGWLLGGETDGKNCRRRYTRVGWLKIPFKQLIRIYTAIEI